MSADEGDENVKNGARISILFQMCLFMAHFIENIFNLVYMRDNLFLPKYGYLPK